MQYNFQEDGDLATLEDYKIRLARQMLRSAFFQDEVKEDFDMLR